MMVGSSLLWGANVMYVSAVPFVGMVICAKTFGSRERLYRSEPQYQLQR